MTAAVRVHPLARTDDGWEVFDPRSSRGSRGQLRVGIVRTGKLVLSPMALDAIGGCRSVLVLIDRRNRRIALRGTTDSQSALKVAPNNRQISGREVLRELGYDYTAGRSWAVPQIEGNLLIIDLAEAEANRKGQS